MKGYTKGTCDLMILNKHLDYRRNVYWAEES
jgi:hypothetical protein